MNKFIHSKYLKKIKWEILFLEKTWFLDHMKDFFFNLEKKSHLLKIISSF